MTAFAVLVLIMVIHACTKDELDVTGSIFGKITDAATSEKLAGVRVSLSPGGESMTTGSDGAFEFPDLEPGQYEIQAQKLNYQTNTKRITVVAGKQASGDLELVPVAKNAKLELSVSTLAFGKDNTDLSFNIINKGNEKFNWNISGMDGVNWLSITPITGSVEAGKSHAVKVTLLRDRIAGNVETTIIINADKESVSLKITAGLEEITSKIGLSVNKLEFGTEQESMTFNVKNIGNAGAVDWTITGIDVDWLTVSPAHGNTDMGKSTAVKVSVDRSKVKGVMSTDFMVVADGESLPMNVTVEEKTVQKYLAVAPEILDLGTNESGSFTIRSYNGATAYQLMTRGDASWITFSKISGTIPQYDENVPTTTELISVFADRRGMEAGTYSCVVIVRSELGDKEIAVSMTVDQSNLGPESVVSNGLYAYFTFEGVSSDITETGLNSVCKNTSYVSSYNGTQALKFTASEGSTLTIPEGLVDQRKMSVSFWVKGLTDGHIFHVIKSNNYSAFCLFMVDGSLKFNATEYTNSYPGYDRVPAFTHNSLSSGWHMVTLVSDFNETTYATVTTKLYVDGIYTDQTTESANPFSEAESGGNYNHGIKFQFGGSMKRNSTVTLNPVPMTIDNLRVYKSRNLSADEVKTIYNAEKQ